MQFTCDACGTIQEYDPAKTLQAMPSGWRMQKISSSSFILCSSCGHPSNFHGGIAPHLKEILKERQASKSTVLSNARKV